ncbi:MAG: hypothetical protein CSA81_04650 [Acidobacteria bacterium]|nr:MAG: hypothetical protein CSA81_04650 [Acidobacteriota bacterium]
MKGCIAIYSGVIPSTTFIEQLIEGVANQGKRVLLVGKKKGQVQYKSSLIKVITLPKNNLAGLPILLYRLFLLLVKKPVGMVSLISLIQPGPKKITKMIHFLNRSLPFLLTTPDIIHVQWAHDVCFFVELKKVIDFKLLVSFRGTQITTKPVVYDYWAEAYKKCFPYVDGFHAVSEAISREGEKYGAAKDKTVIIKPAVKEHLIAQKQAPPINKNQTTKLISVGRKHWKKGYRTALDACYLLKQKKFDFSYSIIIGKPSEELLYQVKDLGLENHVTFHTNLPHSDVLDLIKEADIMLLPSLEEGIANVVLESMALGTPVISTNCGGMREVIRHKENGFLVPLCSPRAFVDCIELWSAGDLQFKTTLLDNAAATVKTAFTATRQIERFNSWYHSFFQDR